MSVPKQQSTARICHTPSRRQPAGPEGNIFLEVVTSEKNKRWPKQLHGQRSPAAACPSQRALAICRGCASCHVYGNGISSVCSSASFISQSNAFPAGTTQNGRSKADLSIVTVALHAGSAAGLGAGLHKAIAAQPAGWEWHSGQNLHEPLVLSVSTEINQCPCLYPHTFFLLFCHLALQTQPNSLA